MAFHTYQLEAVERWKERYNETSEHFSPDRSTILMLPPLEKTVTMNGHMRYGSGNPDMFPNWLSIYYKNDQGHNVEKLATGG